MIIYFNKYIPRIMEKSEFSFDRFIRIPVRIYNSSEVRRVKEKDDNLEIDHPLDYAVGYVFIMPDRIVSFQDYFEKGRSFSDIERTGFDSTLITTEDDCFECDLTLDEFEQILIEYEKTSAKYS